MRGITQTPDGYLWVATLDGLVRFDGNRFTIFNKSNSPGIISNRFTAIGQGRDGDLWLVYEIGGVLRYHAGKFRTYDTRDGIPGEVVSMVTTDNAGHLWLLSRGHIAEWNENTHRFDLSADLNSRIYGPLVWDSPGFQAYDKENVYCFSRGIYKIYSLPPRLRGKIIAGVGLDQGWTAWILFSDGELVRLGPGDPSRTNELPRQAEVPIRGPDGKVWVSRPITDLARAVSVMVGGVRREIVFRYAFPDDQGNLWLATEDGLYRLQDQIVSVLSVAQGLQDRDIYPVLQDKSGAVWIGAWHKGLSRFKNGQFQNFTIADNLKISLVTSLYEDRSGRLWIGGHGGLTTYEGGHFSNSGIPPFSGQLVQAIYEDRSGSMWFGTRFGVFSWKDGALQPFPVKGASAPNDVHVITQDKDGDLWFGGSNGLFQLHGGALTHWSEANGLGSDNIWSLRTDPDGTLWVGTFDGGLARLSKGMVTRYTTANGLFNDGAFQILDDGQGNLWMSCDLGIYRVSKRELIDMAEGKRSYLTSVAYGKADGLPTLQLNGGGSPAGTKTNDGKLWFPTQDGVAVVDPRDARAGDRAIQVAVESAAVDQISVSTDAPIRLRPSDHNLQFQYTAPDFVRPNQLRFRYKLEGLDNDWTESGLHRFASYTHLPPGHYGFVVSAMNESGVWSTPSRSIAVDVLAPFYKTPEFNALLLMCLATIGFAIRRRRHLATEARQALQLDFLRQLITSQEDERKRIARELHDSLGQRLVIINSAARLALRFRNPASRSDESVYEEISAEAAAGLDDTRSIAYNLRPSHLDRLGLTKSLEYLVQKASSASGIEIVADLDDIDALLPADQWINVYRIAQEAIGNIVKYSSASKAVVRVQREGRRALMTIEDDGVGFVVDGTTNRAGRLGMGLRGMSERASLIGGIFAIRSAPGSGTIIEVQIGRDRTD